MTDHEKKELKYLDIYVEGIARRIQKLSDEINDLLVQAERVIAEFRGKSHAETKGATQEARRT